MSDWEDAPVKVSHNNVRNFANIGADGTPNDKPSFDPVAAKLSDQELKNITPQKLQAHDGWEDVPWEDAPAKEGILGMAAGAGETALSMVSGGLGSIFGGIAGIGDAALHGPESATKTVHKVADAMTYSPRTATGKKYSKATGEWLTEQIDKSAAGLKEALKDVPNLDDNQREMLAKIVAETGANFLPLEGIGGLARFRNKKAAKAAEASARADRLSKLQEQQATAPQSTNAATAAHADDFAAMNPYDVGGHLSNIENGKVTTIDGFQKDFFENAEPLPRDPAFEQALRERLPDLPEVERPPVLPDVGQQMELPGIRMSDGTVPLIDEAIPKVGKDRPVGETPLPEIDPRLAANPLDVGLTDPMFDNGVRHPDPNTGKTVQGMDASVPTVDFPLRQEVIANDPRIQGMRDVIEQQRQFNEAARQQGATAERMKALEDTLNHLQSEFARYMDESYGVKSASEISTAKLFESGKETKLPIEKTTKKNGSGGTSVPGVKRTFNPRGFKRQGGAIDPKAIREGLKKLFDGLKRDGEHREYILIHGGGSFDQVNPSFFGKGEPRNIRPLGNGLYGYLAKSPEEAMRAIKAAKEYTKYAPTADKAIHAFKVEVGPGESVVKGKLWADNLLTPEQKARAAEYDAANKIPPGPARTAAYDALDKKYPRKTLAELRAEDAKFPFQSQYLDGLDLVEFAAQDPSRLQRIGKWSAEMSDEAIAEQLATPKPTESLMDRVKKQNEVSSALGKFGKNKNQGGAIDPKAIREGINKLKEKFSKAGVPDVVAKAAAEQAGKPEAPAPVVNEVAQYLKDSAAGNGIADIASLSLTPNEVIQAAKAFGEDIKRQHIQENIENGGIFRMLATKGHPVVKYTVERFNDAVRVSDKWVRDVLTHPDNGVKARWRDMPKLERAEIWHAMSMNEGHNVLSAEALRTAGFTDKQIAFYEAFRAADDAAFQRFNDTRAKMGLPPIERRIAHLAGRFAGPWRQVVYREIRKADGSISKDVIGVITSETNIAPKWDKFRPDAMKSELQRAREWIQEHHPDWKFDKVEYRKLGQGNRAADRFHGMMEVMNLLGKDDPHVKQLIDTYGEFLKTDAQNFLNALRHAKFKKAEAGGVKGSQGNKPWESRIINAHQGMEAQLAYLEQNARWTEMQEANMDVGSVLKDPEIALNMENATKWASMYTDHVLGKNKGWVANVANTLINEVGKHTGLGHSMILKGSNEMKHLMMQKFMGFFSIPFSWVQLMQPLQTMPPALTFLKSRGIEASMFKAAMEGTSAMMRLGLDQAFPRRDGMLRFSGIELRALDYARDRQVFDVKMVDHTTDINSSRLKDAFDAFADFNIKVPEMITRGTAYMTFVHALKDHPGLTEKQIFSAAEHMTQLAMGDYTPFGRPMVYGHMGWMGDLASTLTRYKHNQLSEYALYTREAKKNGSYAPVLTLIGSSLAINGVLGFIGYKEADTLYRLFSTHVLGKPDSITSNLMKLNIPEQLSHGIHALAGLDMTSRFSANILPESVGGFLMPYGSAVADMFSTAGDAISNPNDFNVKRAIKAWAPTSMQGPLENLWFTKKTPDGMNQVTNSGVGTHVGEANYKRTDEEKNLRWFGVKSLEEGKTSARLFEQKFTYDQPRIEIRKKAIKNAVTEYLSGSLTDEKVKELEAKYVANDSANFGRDLAQALQNTVMTPEQRYLYRNTGPNFTAAKRLQNYIELGYKGKK